MKQITKNTLLRCNDKSFQPVEVDGVVYWVDEEATECRYYLHNSIDGRHQIYDLENGGSLLDFKRGQPIKWCSKIVAQSSPKLEGIPVISLDSYVEKQIKDWYNVSKLNSSFIADPNSYKQGYKSNPNKYTQADIDKAYQMGHEDKGKGFGNKSNFLNRLEQINSIEVIEVDVQFNILSYE